MSFSTKPFSSASDNKWIISEKDKKALKDEAISRFEDFKVQIKTKLNSLDDSNSLNADRIKKLLSDINQLNYSSLSPQQLSEKHYEFYHSFKTLTQLIELPTKDIEEKAIQYERYLHIFINLFSTPLKKLTHIYSEREDLFKEIHSDVYLKNIKYLLDYFSDIEKLLLQLYNKPSSHDDIRVQIHFKAAEATLVKSNLELNTLNLQGNDRKYAQYIHTTISSMLALTQYIFETPQVELPLIDNANSSLFADQKTALVNGNADKEKLIDEFNNLKLLINTSFKTIQAAQAIKDSNVINQADLFLRAVNTLNVDLASSAMLFNKYNEFCNQFRNLILPVKDQSKTKTYQTFLVTQRGAFALPAHPLTPRPSDANAIPNTSRVK